MPFPDINSMESVPDGWQACLVCNKVGIKDSYYGKTKDFCSIACIKSRQEMLQQHQQQNQSHQATSIPSAPTNSLLVGMDQCRLIRRKPFPFPSHQLSKGQLYPIQKNINAILRLTSNNNNNNSQQQPQSFSPIEMNMIHGDPFARVDHRTFVPLSNMIQSGMFHQVNSLHLAFELHTFAPVRAFAHAPLRDNWDDLFKRVVVDVRQPYRNNYWRAEIITSFGYFLKLRHLGSGPVSNGNNIFLVNPRLRNLLPIVQRDQNGAIIKREYVPPNCLRHAKIENIFDLPQNVATLENDLYVSFKECFVEYFDLDVFYEVIDQMDPSRFVCCKILSKFGDWLFVRYELGKDDNRSSKTAWVHPKSGFFRVMGWSQLIGYPIYASNSYISLSLYTLTRCETLIDHYLTNPEAFPYEPNMSNLFPVGSYLEFLDPFNHKMKIAVVIKKLRFGFMVIEYEDQLPGNSGKPTQIFQHVTSTLIFPIGFCQKHCIPLYVSNGVRFDPKMTKLAETIETKAAPIMCFPKIANTNTIFKQGMILETFNMVGRGVVSYAIVDRVVDRLLALRFINQEPYFELWVDHESHHLRPFGYTHMLDLSSEPSSHPLYIDNIRFAELHLKIVQFKATYKEYMRSVNTQLINANDLTSSKPPLSPKVIQHQQQLIKPNQLPQQQIVLKVHGNNFGRYGNLIIRPSPINSNVCYPSIKIDAKTKVFQNVNSNENLTELTSKRKSLVQGPSKTTEAIDQDLNFQFTQIPDVPMVDLVNQEVIEIEDDNIPSTNIGQDNFGFSTDVSDILEDISKQELFLEFQRKVHRLAQLNPPDLTGLNSKSPLEWTATDVQTFLHNNFRDKFEHFQFNSSMEINGRKFLQMDHIDFNAMLRTSSMSLAIWLHILKLCLIEHLKLNLDDIFCAENINKK